MRRLILPSGASPRAWGQLHGETFRDEIKAIARIRAELCLEVGGFPNMAAVFDAADAHIPVLQQCDQALFDEFLGIAEGAGVAPAEIVIVNHYTDLRDLGPNTKIDAEPEDDCSALTLRPEGGAFLAQTWDMHGSAKPFVFMLGVPEHEVDGQKVPGAWLLSITGCLGMAGLNAHGVGVTINNLKSTDAVVGLLWPALIRLVLRQDSAQGGAAVIRNTPIGSGHHYLMVDAQDAVAMETSGRLKETVFSGTGPVYHHTNHCLDDRVAAHSLVAPTSTTEMRYDYLSEKLNNPPSNLEEIWALLSSHEGFPKSICTHLATEENPHAMLSCAGLAMDLKKRIMWGAEGCLQEHPAETFTFPVAGA